MKKGKWMLVVTLIFAISATSLAFSVNSFSTHFVYTGNQGSGVCINRHNGCGITTGSPNSAASTVAMGSNCPDAYTVSGSN